MKSFITGSRAYGNPKKDSDIDLVIRVDPSMAQILRKLSDDSGETGEKPCRFGRLNLILAESDLEFAVWRLGTTSMKSSKRKYSKHAAKAVLDNLREQVGLLDRSQSG